MVAAMKQMNVKKLDRKGRPVTKIDVRIVGRSETETGGMG